MASFLPRLSSAPETCQFGDLGQPLDGLADGLEVGEHAAQPALVDERLAGAGGFALHRFAGGTLRAYEKHGAAIGNDALDEVRSFRVQGLRLFEVDDVDLVAFAKDEMGHLRVPEAGLMSEMDTRFQHLSHGHAGHIESPVWVGPPRIPGGHP